MRLFFLLPLLFFLGNVCHHFFLLTISQKYTKKKKPDKRTPASRQQRDWNRWCGAEILDVPSAPLQNLSLHLHPPLFPLLFWPCCPLSSPLRFGFSRSGLLVPSQRGWPRVRGMEKASRRGGDSGGGCKKQIVPEWPSQAGRQTDGRKGTCTSADYSLFTLWLAGRSPRVRVGRGGSEGGWGWVGGSQLWPSCSRWVNSCAAWTLGGALERWWWCVCVCLGADVGEGRWPLVEPLTAMHKLCSDWKYYVKMTGGCKIQHGWGTVCVCVGGFFAGVWADTGAFSYRPQWSILDERH